MKEIAANYPNIMFGVLIAIMIYDKVLKMKNNSSNSTQSSNNKHCSMELLPILSAMKENLISIKELSASIVNKQSDIQECVHYTKEKSKDNHKRLGSIDNFLNGMNSDTNMISGSIAGIRGELQAINKKIDK